LEVIQCDAEAQAPSPTIGESKSTARVTCDIFKYSQHWIKDESDFQIISEIKDELVVGNLVMKWKVIM